MALALQPRGRNLLGLAEAAALAGVHRNTVRAWCASGRLPSVKVNARGDRRVRREDVERLVAARASADPHVPRSRPSRGSPTRLAVVREQLRRGDVLRRIASEISGQLDLPQLFEEVIDESFALFGVDRAGLWLYEDRPQPLTFAAQRGLSNEMLVEIEKLPRDAPTAGMSAMRDREVHVLEGTLEGTTPALRETYVRHGIRTICFVPVAFRDEPLGLLALYHHRRYDWTSDETGLARAFADHMATAIGTARLFESSRALADRLRVISDLAVRLNRIQDLEGIGQTIVSSARRVIQHDTIRVYRVDHASATCEPIAFEGRFRGIRDASVDSLRVKVGTGLTGWCAANNEPIRIGDARADPRSVIVGDTEEPESMLLVPMTYEEVVRGVIVVSKVGLERFTADDETALSIFAGYAAQALVNADNLERLHRQQAEREHQLASQRRLLEINERLLSTLDPSGVLDLIADSLKTIVPYDSLTVYRSDPARGVRRAVIARDRFADLILADEAPLRAGVTGWVIEHSEAVMANDAHLDPRSVQVPGTPFEPESIVVVPLLVNGEVIGTLNVGRVGGVEAHFDGNEFELVKLFAGQASIALQNAETHGEVRVRADHDALTGLRNHGAFQRELGAAVAAADGSPLAVLMLDLDGFKAYNDTLGHPAGDALLAEAAAAMSGVLRDGDRLYRYGGDEFAVVVAGAGRAVAYDVAARLRTAVAGLRDPGRGPRVSITAGIASYPEDGRTKDQLVAAADRALYHAKPGRRGPPARGTPEDPYLRALDETAIALVERRDPASLVETIMSRAAALVGTPHAFLCLVEPDSDEIVVQHGAGSFADIVGQRFGLAEGLAGEVVRTGQPLAIDDYDTYAGRSELPQGRFGAVVGVPLTSAGKVLGVLGLGAGDIERTFGPAEIDALTRFAKLASIALDNARLFDAAQRVALYDTTTGLPNRELLMDRIGQALARTGPEAGGAIGVLLLDLDRFKVINESVGHAVGDRLLDAVGQRLVACLSPGDTVGRFGGDEFAVVLATLPHPDAAREVAERIQGELRPPFPLGDREWFISAAVGIAIGWPGRSTADELLREAEIATVRAKADPATRLAIFEPAMSTQTLERIDLENDLRRGIERGELRLVFQPVVDLRDERMVGFEALVRWHHPDRGLLSPADFIGVAEETGLIIPLGRWVLATACRQVGRWQTGPHAVDGLFVSVNLSAREFSQPDLVERVASILAGAGVDASALQLEITESVLMDQSEVAVRVLRRLRALGVRLVLDDFGTGYSSLSYLKHLPLDAIKIDRSFVAGLGGDADRSIVDAVVGLAHGLRIGVVAEGIETADQLAILRELGCDLGQGFLFSEPVPARSAARFLRPGSAISSGRYRRAAGGTGTG